MGASAFVDGVANDDYTAKIQYLFVGIDENGNAVSATDASKLGNGAYTEIAYITDGVSASMVYAEPIMCSFVVAPQVYGVTFVDENANPNDDRLFTYDGQAHGMDVLVTDPAGQPIGLTLEAPIENLTVTYIGIEGDGEGYHSAGAPKDEGLYTVIAVYAEYDGNGNLLYAGAAVGAMAIQPADSGFAVNDTVEVYDGSEKFPLISNPNNLPFVLSVVVDSENNVNVIAPEGWNVENRTIENVDDVIATLIAELEDMASVAQNEGYKAALEKLAEALKTLEIKSLTINGDKPVAVGTYTIHAIGFGDPNLVPAYDNGILEIVVPEEDAVIASGFDAGLLDVTVSWDGGSANLADGGVSVPAGTEVTLTVVVAEGKELESFSIDDSNGEPVVSEFGSGVFVFDVEAGDTYTVSATVLAPG